MKFPLPLNQIPRMDLTQAQKENYAAFASKIVHENIQEYKTHMQTYHGTYKVDGKQWKFLKKKERVSIYKQREVFDDQPSQFLAVGSIKGKLEDVMYGLVGDTREDMVLRAAYAKTAILDAEVLETIKEPTLEHPFCFTGIKWIVQDHPKSVKSFVRLRDFVFLESKGIIETKEKETIGYHLLHSIDVPIFPALENQPIVRGRLFFCYLYRQLDHGFVDVYLRGYFELYGNIPDAVATKSATDSLSAIWRVPQYAQAKKLMYMLQLARKLVTKEKDTDSHWCHVCSKLLGGIHSSGMNSRRLFHKHSSHNCKICQRSMCSTCSIQKPFYFFVKQGKVTKKQLTFCTLCIMQASKQKSEQLVRLEMKEFVLEEEEEEEEKEKEEEEEQEEEQEHVDIDEDDPATIMLKAKVQRKNKILETFFSTADVFYSFSSATSSLSTRSSSLSSSFDSSAISMKASKYHSSPKIIDHRAPLHKRQPSPVSTTVNRSFSFDKIRLLDLGDEDLLTQSTSIDLENSALNVEFEYIP